MIHIYMKHEDEGVVSKQGDVPEPMQEVKPQPCLVIESLLNLEYAPIHLHEQVVGEGSEDVRVEGSEILGLMKVVMRVIEV